MSYSPPPAYQPPSQPEFAAGGEPPLWAPWYGIPFQAAIRRALKKYADFSGRASRSEFWWWYLAAGVISLVLQIVHSAVGNNAGGVVIYIISLLYSLAIIVPQLAITWRRLHDTGRSGGWFFIGFIPLVGWIILLVFLVSGPKPEGQRFDRPRA